MLLPLVAQRPAGAVEDLLTPRSIGVGDALRADATGALGPLFNPSGMALIKNYTLEAAYGFDVPTIGSKVHLSIVDSSTNRLAMGVYYTFVHDTPKYLVPAYGRQPLTHEGNETGLAFAIPLGDYVYLGLTTKYVRFATTFPNPLYNASTNAGVPQTYAIDDSTQAVTNGFTTDFGVTLKLGQYFRIAVVGYNLIPLSSFDAPLSMATGIAIKPIPSLTIAIDDLIDFDKYGKWDPAVQKITSHYVSTRVGGGIEFLAGGKVPIRVGSSYDTGAPAGYLSLGLGYLSTQFGIDLSYRQQVTNGNDSFLNLGIRVFLQ